MLDLIYYIGVPIFLALSSGVLAMYKNQSKRINDLEDRLDSTEKSIVEVKMDVKYMSRDIKEIKENVQKLVNRNY